MNSKHKSYSILACSAMVLLLSITAVDAQQTCSINDLLSKKGAWKKTGDANMKAGNQSQAISRIDKMQKILQAAYPDPHGMEAIWYRTMVNQPLVPNGANPYQLAALFKLYYCLSDKEMKLGDETATWFYVYANHFNWFLNYDHFFTVKKNPVYLLTKKVGEIHGYPVYEGIHNGTSNTGTYYSRTIIITRPGQSPYVPVHRSEYLRLYLKRLEKDRPVQLSYIENRQVKTDLDKKKKEEDFKNISKLYADLMKPTQDLLASMTEEEAQMPAIVKGDYVGKFERFFTEAEGGQMLVRLNPDYFNTKLPGYVPQFLVVYWRWQKNKLSENFHEELEKHFDFAALQAMLDK